MTVDMAMSIQDHVGSKLLDMVPIPNNQMMDNLIIWSIPGTNDFLTAIAKGECIVSQPLYYGTDLMAIIKGTPS